MKKIVKKFSLSYGDLLTTSHTLLSTVNRDAEVFTEHGYDLAKLQDYEALINQVTAIPSDKELRVTQTNKTREKNETRGLLISTLKEIKLKLIIKTGLDSDLLQRLEIKDLTASKDSSLSLIADRCLRILKEAGDDFQSKEDVEKLSVFSAAFKSLLVAQHNSITARDIATRSRHLLSNSLYDETLLICYIGRSIWAETDPARYNDYVVHVNPHYTVSAQEEENDTGELVYSDTQSEAA